jgi:GTP1/Obg family GTP-binding protein
MTLEERRRKRQQKKTQKQSSTTTGATGSGGNNSNNDSAGENDQRFATLLARREDDLLRFVAKVNKVYQELLGKPAPFMTFIFCGMQSAGKSTIMERFLGAVLNIVQKGTGTRCPLDTTCIHDSSIV